MCGEIRGGRYDAPMTCLSDPSRASRCDRRKAQMAIDAGYAAGRLTAADRTLRMQRIEAAQTRGDLAMITRDLGGPAAAATPPEPEPQGQLPQPSQPSAPPTLGSAIDPTLLESMRVKPTHRSTASGAPSARTVSIAPNARKILMVIALVVAGMVGLCALGIVGVVVSAINGATDGPRTPATSTPSGEADTESPAGAAVAGLHTPAGWRAFVAAVKSESGTTRVYDAVVYPEYAAVALVSGDGADRRVFRDGEFLDSFRVHTQASGSPVDLGRIDPDVFARLPQTTADRLGADKPTDAYMIINALPADPRIIVYIQANGGSQYRIYDLDGAPVD
jgi:hypothetical protein